MYSKDMLIGIILSKFNFTLDISVDETRKIGYRTRIIGNCFGSEEFINGVVRSLAQHGISVGADYLTSAENTRKNTSYISISQIDQLSKLISLTPNIPNAKNDLELLREAILLVKDKKHLTLDGLERLISIKEMRNYGINNNEQ